MFKSQAMSKVELVVPESEVVPATEALAASGVFHPAMGGHMELTQDPSEESLWRDWAVTFVELERRLLAVMETLEVDEGAPPEETPHLIEPEVAQRDVEHLEEEAQVYTRELKAARQHLSDLQQYKKQMQSIKGVDVNIDELRNLEYLFLMPGTMPLDNVERFRSSLEHVPFVLVTLDQDRYLATVVLVGTQRDAGILERAARSAYLNPIRLPPEYRGTPAEVLEALKVGIRRTQARITEIQNKIHQLHEMRIRHLRCLLWRVRASQTLVETIASYDHLRYTYLVVGWVPTKSLSKLRETIGTVSKKVMIEVVDQQRLGEEPVPIALDNPWPLRGFQSLVTNYGHPSYGELDPTVLLALTFPLVFGVMFGDVGQGLLLTLVGLLFASRRVRSLRKFAEIGVVLAACGVAATIFGFLYGSVFGFEDLLQPLWIRPLEQITDVLLVAVAMGGGILSLGMVTNMVNAALESRWGHFIFGHHGLAGLLFYWSALGVAISLVSSAPLLPVTVLIVVMALSGVALTFGELFQRLVEGEETLIEEGIGTYLMQAFFELFEVVIGLLSNTLSYVRMGAFAVAHGALSLVVFILAELVSPTRGLGYWLVVVLGNLFIIGFEGMIVGIQTLRLEYYEFFSKFFSGTGVVFHPLALIPQGEK